MAAERTVTTCYVIVSSRVFFFNDTATTEIYTLSLHDALPISWAVFRSPQGFPWRRCFEIDRKSTRLNSSHLVISYAVFCLKKKRTTHECVFNELRDSMMSLHSLRVCAR